MRRAALARTDASTSPVAAHAVAEAARLGLDHALRGLPTHRGGGDPTTDGCAAGAGLAEHAVLPRHRLREVGGPQIGLHDPLHQVGARSTRFGVQNASTALPDVPAKALRRRNRIARGCMQNIHLRRWPRGSTGPSPPRRQCGKYIYTQYFARQNPERPKWRCAPSCRGRPGAAFAGMHAERALPQPRRRVPRNGPPRPLPQPSLRERKFVCIGTARIRCRAIP